MNNDYGLDTLNDYILLIIIDFLDLKTKLKVHLTCKRFHYLISGWFYKQKALGDLNYSQIDLCNNQVHRLDEYQFSLRPITDNSSNNDWNLNIMLLNRVFQLAKNVECLHFNCLDDENSVNERLIISILGSLPKLTCLSFGIGLQISSKNWNLIINQLGNQLKHLQINRVNYLTLENIVRHCPNLITLHIRFCPSSIGCVFYLWPKLRRLKIQSMTTIYLRNALFTDRSRYSNFLENEDDDNIINLVDDEVNVNNVNQFGPRDNLSSSVNNSGSSTDNNLTINSTRNENNIQISRTEQFLNQLDNIWYLNLIELRLNRVTVKSLTVIFNHCISLQVLDLVLFFNRQSLVLENQDFIQVAHRLMNMRLFALDVHSKWLSVQLDKGLALMLNEWPKIEVLILKRGLITEDLFDRIKQVCKNLKVICVEFYDQVPYNHRLNEITDRVVDSLIQLSELTKLRLHFTGITDEGTVKLIESCKKLKYLDLFGCTQITCRSLKAISNHLNKANRCNAIFLGDTNNFRKRRSKMNEITILTRNIESHQKYNLGLKNKANQSTEVFYRSIDSSESTESIDSDYSLYSCKKFNTITANCIECDKEPMIFYLSINKTKINLKKDKINYPNTLFILSEDDQLWNCYNYPISNL